MPRIGVRGAKTPVRPGGPWTCQVPRKSQLSYGAYGAKTTVRPSAIGGKTLVHPCVPAI
jgi:hypothetical protein